MAVVSAIICARARELEGRLKQFLPIPILRKFDSTIIDHRTNGELRRCRVGLGCDRRVLYQRMSRLVQHIGLQISVTKTRECSSVTIMLVDWLHRRTQPYRGAWRICHV
jgi:hypothetical protein